MGQELKECPFCGSQNISLMQAPDNEWTVVCHGCHSGTGHSPSKKVATEHWNRRAAQAGWVAVPREPTPEMIQAMEDRQVEGAGYIAENSIQYALWKEVWKAALSALPPAPAKEGEKG